MNPRVFEAFERGEIPPARRTTDPVARLVGAERALLALLRDGARGRRAA